MRKIILFLLTLLTIWSCKNEDDGLGRPILSEAATTFVKLSDDMTQMAGKVKIVADVPEVELVWITEQKCNLDTSQTKVILKNGIGEFSVKWLNKQDETHYAPQNMAFKAWVRIKAGNELTDIPLILSERVDSTKLMQMVKTRASEMLPKIVSLEFNPSVVNLQTATGGRTQVVASEIQTVDIDYSSITDAMGIDKTGLPTSITQSEYLDFVWIGGVAPTTAFATTVRAQAIEEDLWATCTLNYNPNGGGDTELEYQNSTMPTTGNLPATSSIYTFNFTGAYTGNIQIRTLSNGVLLYTATPYQYPAKQPRARVPENTGGQRPVEFEYRKGTGNWIAIPEANRIQDGAGTTPPQPGSPSYGPISPTGDIPDAGGDYNCVFSNYTGQIYFQAVSGQGRLLAETSDIIPANGFKQLFLTIPEATSLTDNTVIFQYRTDGTGWKSMETRTQIVETFGTGYIHDMPEIIPVNGGTYIYTSSGTLSSAITVLCQDADKNVLAESKGAAGGSINVVVPVNGTGDVRKLYFYLKLPNQPDKSYLITQRQQAAY